MSGREVLVLVFGLWLAGCESEEQAKSSTELFCEGLCDSMRACNVSSGRGSCEGDCADDRPGLRHLSHDGAEALGDCAAGLSCSVFTSEALWDAGFQACWDAARVRVRATEKVRSFCAGFAQAWFECGSFVSVSECERSFGMWADDVLDQVARCESQPTCEALSSCVDGTFQAL